MDRQRKISIRFYQGREVRAVWDDENAKWWFSVLDVVGAINEQDDYTRTRNYWKYLKTKLRKQGNELVSATNQLKLLVLDGKHRLTDVLDYDDVMLLSFYNSFRVDLLTDKVDDRETFLKGIDYSYYYEQED